MGSRLSGGWRAICPSRLTDAQVWGLVALATAVLVLLAGIWVARVLNPALNPPPEQIVVVTVTLPPTALFSGP
jgi:hypothetical protein